MSPYPPVLALALLLSGLRSTSAQSHNIAPDAGLIPWGIASSSSAVKNHAEWFPKMTAAGIPWVRLFPEWRGLEPAQGTWKWEKLDAMLKSAAENKIQISAILMGSMPWTKGGSHAFPMDHLDDWSTYVATTVDHCKSQVHYWEVWNEGNGGFNDNKNTTTDYANLVAAAYTSAKKADPTAQIGMTVASFDAPYLQQAMIAQAKAGKANSFDYLCVHPYEIADNISLPNGELPYLWMTHHLREALKTSAPERANADIWITEVGQKIETKKGKITTEEEAAKALVKIYTMSLAQGIKRTQWFEGQDPIGEEAGFGLLKRDGSPRASYQAFKTLTTVLGASPVYIGWLALGQKGHGFGFVFQSATSPVMAAWMTAGESDKTLIFAKDVQVMDATTGSSATLTKGQALDLTDKPVFIIGLPANMLAQAQANAAKLFPWGGDYSSANAVSIQHGSSEANQGIYALSHSAATDYQFPDGTTGVQINGSPYATYFVHPSFANLQTHNYYIRITVRHIGPGNAGMNLNYEVADSQGRSPYKNKGEWFSLTADPGWQTHTWHVTDACFSKMWGYDFNFHPENAAPFVIGKVEVSKVPF